MDLADLISRGAVAALDLAPLDPRFSGLSRQVLQGGASRFAPVVDASEPVEYVVPVGVPEASVNFGALVIQHSRVGLVWRDARQGDRHALVALGPDTRAEWSPVTLGGEQWARFDLVDGDTTLSFLAPPTGSPLLRTTLARLLSAGPAGSASDTQRIPAVPPSGPAPVPRVSPSAGPAWSGPLGSGPARSPAPAWSAPAAPAAVPPAVSPVPVPPASPVPAAPAPPPVVVPTWQAPTAGPLYRDEERVPTATPWADPEATVVRPAPGHSVPTPVVAAPGVAEAPVVATSVFAAPAAPAPAVAGSATSAPAAAGSAAAPPVFADPAVPAPVAAAPAVPPPLVSAAPVPRAPAAPTPASAVTAPRAGLSTTLIGFLVGLAAALVLGGALLAMLVS